VLQQVLLKAAPQQLSVDDKVKRARRLCFGVVRWGQHGGRRRQQQPAKAQQRGCERDHSSMICAA
jgi:hypothetical protein